MGQKSLIFSNRLFINTTPSTCGLADSDRLATIPCGSSFLSLSVPAGGIGAGQVGTLTTSKIPTHDTIMDPRVYCRSIDYILMLLYDHGTCNYAYLNACILCNFVCVNSNTHFRGGASTAPSHGTVIPVIKRNTAAVYNGLGYCRDSPVKPIPHGLSRLGSISKNMSMWGHMVI